MDGVKLLELLIEGTGLPRQIVEDEIHRLVREKGLTVESITMDDIRDMVASYMQDTLLEAKQAQGSL